MINCALSKNNVSPFQWDRTRKCIVIVIGRLNETKGMLALSLSFHSWRICLSDRWDAQIFDNQILLQYTEINAKPLDYEVEFFIRWSSKFKSTTHAPVPFFFR